MPKSFSSFSMCSVSLRQQKIHKMLNLIINEMMPKISFNFYFNNVNCGSVNIQINFKILFPQVFHLWSYFIFILSCKFNIDKNCQLVFFFCHTSVWWTFENYFAKQTKDFSSWFLLLFGTILVFRNFSFFQRFSLFLCWLHHRYFRSSSFFHK